MSEVRKPAADFLPSLSTSWEVFCVKLKILGVKECTENPGVVIVPPGHPGAVLCIRTPNLARLMT